MVALVDCEAGVGGAGWLWGWDGAYFPSGVYALYRPRRAVTRGAYHNRGGLF